ncbi:MAG: LysM domain-containing protein [Parvularculaceae bacterium]
MFLNAKSPIMAAAVVALFAAGCASDDPNIFAAAEYAGANSLLYQADPLRRVNQPIEIDPDTGAVIEAAYYLGIDGARRAHATYGEDIAEALDGRCEPFVRTAHNENLANVASLCDVDVAELVDFNPNIGNPYVIKAGALVGVPNAEIGVELGGSTTGGADLIRNDVVSVDVYTVRPGESVRDVARRFNVGANDIAALNPQLVRTSLRAGDRVRVPALAGKSRGAKGVARNDVAPRPSIAHTRGERLDVAFNDAPPAFNDAPIARQPRAPSKRGPAPQAGAPSYGAVATRTSGGGWEGYDGYLGEHEEPAVTDEEVARHKPLRLGPVGALPERGAAPSRRYLVEVSAAAVRPGGTVEVRLGGLEPGERVTFYRGHDPRDLTAPRTSHAGGDGVARASFYVPRATELGGLVFSATRERDGVRFHSRRVAVVGVTSPFDSAAVDARDEGPLRRVTLEEVVDHMRSNRIATVDELQAAGVAFFPEIDEADYGEIEERAYFATR